MYYKQKSYLQKTKHKQGLVHYLKNNNTRDGTNYKHASHSFIQTLFKVQRNSYLSLKERLIDLLDSHDGHFDDKQPLKGDCRNNEDFDSCF